MPYSFAGNFPPHEVGFVEKEDARFYGIETEDTTIRSGQEGGYEIARPQFTRKPKRTYSTGFTRMSQSDFDIIMAFWDEYQGSKQFNWQNPTTQTVHSVRFTEAPNITYEGVGQLFEYTVEVKIKEE